MNERSVRMACAECGSLNVKRDAWAVWGERKQQWLLAGCTDMAYCEQCGGETTIKEIAPVGKCANGCAEIVPTRSASAYWDRDKGAWVLNEDMEEPYCPECNGAIVWGWA